MRILGLHVSRFRFRSTERAIDGAEPLDAERHEVAIDEACLVVFVSVEKGDAGSAASVAAQFTGDTVRRAEKLGVRKVVLYPYVHLTEEPSTPRIALATLREIESRLGREVDLIRAPFGWYKAFELSCLGHPLSEWSARYEPREGVTEIREEKPARKPSEFERFMIADLKGRLFDVTPADFGSCPVWSDSHPAYERLKQFVTNELTQRPPADGTRPKHIEFMRKQELVDYCEVSEKGHHKWYPKGVLILRLLLDYAAQLAREWGAFEMKNPVVIRGDHNVVGQLMGEFHERDYQVDGGRGICYLRYASDPLAFPFMQRVRFSHKQSPLRVYEEASCFRNEQEGEVSGLKRVRNFLMTDMHAACATIEEAHTEFESLCLKFADLMNTIIAKGRWVLGWEGTIEFFERNRDWLVGLGKQMQVPALFKLMPRMSHYYAMKNEYQFITEDRANIQVSTVQWDIKDGERFDIGYTDESGGKRPCPVILHASSFGSIERTLCAMLENIAHDQQAGWPALFPFWLAPTQVRIIPVSGRYVDTAITLCAAIGEAGIRADVDDRPDTVGKKIYNGEEEWVPYLVVVGAKEQSADELTIRSRETGTQERMPLRQFKTLLQDRAKGMPWRPLPLPTLLSRRPSFVG